MAITQKQKATVAIIMFCIAGFIVYNSFFKTETILTESSFSEAETESQDIINLAQEFENITIPTSVFSSPLFRSLTEPGSPVSQEAQGRPNPFAQIGAN